MRLLLSLVLILQDDVPALLEALDTGEPAAVEALRRAGPGKWTEVAKGLEHGKPSVRAGTLLALREVFEEPVVEALVRAATNAQLPAETRAGAVATLAGLHRKPAPSGEKTVEWPGTPRVLETLRSALRDPESALRQAAAAGAGETRDPGAAAALRELFWEEKAQGVRRAMLRALSTLGDPAAGEIASRILKDAAAHAALLGEAIEAAQRAGVTDLPESLIAIVDASESAAILMPAIEGLGALRTGTGALEKRLRHENPGVALAAARALANVGGRWGFLPLMKAADDPRLEVRKGVLAALASFQLPDALPAFFKAYLKPETRSAALIGMAMTTDIRALDFYLEGLTSQDAEVREKSGHALVLLSSQGQLALDPRPHLERKAEAGLMTPELRTELRSLFVKSHPLHRWRVLGPLPSSARPPFDPEINEGGMGEGDLERVYTGVEARDARWELIDASKDGYVDLAARLGPTPEAVAYVFATLYTPKARSVEVRVGAAGTLAIWVGGKLVHERKKAGPWRSGDEGLRVDLPTGGTNLMVRCGRVGKDWGLSVHQPPEMAAKFLDPPPPKRDVKEVLAAAQRIAGDAAMGKTIFTNLQGARCSRCHLTEDPGEEVVEKAGPSLIGVGARLSRKELAESILLPSLKVKEKWRQEVVILRTHQVVQGVVDRSVLDQITIADREGKLRRFLEIEVVDSRETDQSTMPEGLNLGLSPQDVADLVSYLETLK